MINYICYINNKEVQLGELNFEIVKSIANYKIFECNGTITKDLSFPATPNNNGVFGFLYNLNSYSNWDTTKKYNILLYADNSVLLNGYFELTNILIEENKPILYEGTAYADNNILFNSIQDNLMEDLDLSELNHTLTNDNVRSLYNYEIDGTIAGLVTTPIYRNIVYPYIDYGKKDKGWLGNLWTFSGSTSSNGFSCDDVYPGLKLTYLLGKIFSDADCSYESTFLSSDEAKNMIVPFCNSLETISSGNTTLSCSGNSLVEVSLTPWSTFDLQFYNWTPGVVYYNSDAPMNSNQSSLLLDLTYNFKPYQNSKYIAVDFFDSLSSTPSAGLPGSINFKENCDINISLSIELIGNAYTQPIYGNQLVLYKSKTSDYNQVYFAAGINQWMPLFQMDSPGIPISILEFDWIATTQTVTLNVNNIQIEEGEMLYARLLFRPWLYFNVSHGEVKVNKFEIYNNDEYMQGVNLDFNKFWINKNIKQIDFLNDIFKLFNLYIFPDKFRYQHYHIETYDDFIETTNAINLTDELDEIEENIEFINNYKYYNFSYKEDEDFFNKKYSEFYIDKIYGDEKIETNNELTNETAEIKLNVFSPTMIGPIIHWNTIVSGTSYCDMLTSKIYEEEEGIGKEVDFNKFPKTNYNPRLLYYNITSGTTLAWYHFFAFNGGSSLNKFPFSTHLYNSAHGCYFDPYIVGLIEFDNRYDLNFDTEYEGFKPVYPITNDNLYNRFYGKYISEIGSQNTKLFKAKFNLSSTQINNIELNKLIYLEGKGYFIIEELRYTPESLTELDLIKLDNILYTYEPLKPVNIDGIQPPLNTSTRSSNNIEPSDDNNNNGIWGDNIVVGSWNLTNIYKETPEYTTTSYTYYIDNSGTTGATWFTDASAVTYNIITLTGTTYERNSEPNNTFGNYNLIKNSEGNFIYGNNNFIRESSNIGLFNSYACNISNSDSITLINTSNAVITGNTNIIVIGSNEYNYLDNSIYIGNSSTTLFFNGSSGVTVAGNNKEIQFNDGGGFGADQNFTWDKTIGSLSLGNSSTATGVYSTASGLYCVASGNYSHAEGGNTTAFGYHSHAEGQSTIASGLSSHAEGVSTTAVGDYSHAEGGKTTASGYHSHSEGFDTEASGDYSHAEGILTIASGNYSHAEGGNTTASGDYSHAEGASTTAVGYHSHAEGGKTTASGDYSHAQGGNTIASGIKSHAEGFYSIAFGTCSHAEGGATTAVGDYSHAEGANTTASGYHSHAEGFSTTAVGTSSHAEGGSTTASGNFSHAEGANTTASGDYSHAQGNYSIASGTCSHAEGFFSTAVGSFSHVEGIATTASGNFSHAEGAYTITSGIYSHAEGNYSVSTLPAESSLSSGNVENNLSQVTRLVMSTVINGPGSSIMRLDYDTTGSPLYMREDSTWLISIDVVFRDEDFASGYIQKSTMCVRNITGSTYFTGASVSGTTINAGAVCDAPYNTNGDVVLSYFIDNNQPTFKIQNNETTKLFCTGFVQIVEIASS